MVKGKSKYQQLKDLLREDIARGVYRNGERIPGENELAERYGMSRQTVRQALSLLEQDFLIERRQGSGTYVRERQPNRKRSWNVGIIATYISEYIFPSILRGMESELSEAGFFPLLSATQNRVDNERKILEDFLSKDIDGLIVEGTKSALPNPNLALYAKFKEKGIPVVFFNGYYPALGPSTVSVTTNDKSGGQEGVYLLLAKGHQRIGGIFKADDLQGLDRYAGYTRGLLENGLEFRDEWVVWFHSENRNTFLTDAHEQSRILQLLKDCTAVLCYNDEVAAKLVNAFHQHQIVVPQDKAVLSFDNSLLSEVAGVPISSFDHPKENLGACAARKLIGMMNGREEKSTVLEWGISMKDSL